MEANRQELESFRAQWRAEVRARPPTTASQLQSTSAGPSSSWTAPISLPHRTLQHSTKPVKSQKPASQDHDDYYVQPRAFDEDGPAITDTNAEEVTEESESKEPVTALEHYEKAVEREAVGKLGESLSLYRKAFRMDDAVDQKYKSKHFAKAWAPKPAPQPQQGASAPAASSSGQQEEPDAKPKTMNELISSFSGIRIAPAPPKIEGAPQPPCPISELPEETLVHILRDVAVLDVADFVRLARVCKRLAYLVATEDRIWRRVCLGAEFGFGGMHYHWQKQIAWDEISTEDIIRETPEEELDLIPLTLSARTERHREEGLVDTMAFYNSLYESSWLRMFRQRPRIRFNGCYISTVNYIRPGQASFQLRWDNPVHIVTYYRYLRFFRDGTLLSLVTTTEPADVVHHLTREAQALHKGGAMAHLPGVVMQFAFKGRWRLTSASDNPAAAASEAEGDLIVETEGVGKYTYRMDLSLRSAGKGTRNNKMIWRAFHSYDRLTDDWAEFTLKNDKPFFFSRVKSYDIGE